MVGVESRTWLGNPFDPAQWQKLPGVDARDVLNLEQVPSVMRQLSELTPAGTQTIDGDACYRVRGALDSGALALIVPDVAEPGQAVRLDLWIRQSSYQIRRLVIAGALNASEPPGIVRTLDLSRFDAPVEIEPPVGP
jgi:hypothetical protein